VDGGDGIGFQKAVDDMSHRAMGELEVADSDERSASAAFVPAANQLEVRLAASANGVFVWLFLNSDRYVLFNDNFLGAQVLAAAAAESASPPSTAIRAADEHEEVITGGSDRYDYCCIR
jgi:hypothetical protein